MDVENRTVELVQDYISQGRVRAASQGNFYTIPETTTTSSAGALLAPIRSSNGRHLLCEVHWGAGWLFWWERMKSYRVYRAWNWVGFPKYPPSARVRVKSSMSVGTAPPKSGSGNSRVRCTILEVKKSSRHWRLRRRRHSNTRSTFHLTKIRQCIEWWH